MNPERWRLIEQIYDSAIERPPGERRSYVETACAGNSALRDEVLELLAHTDDDSAPWQRPIAVLAGELYAQRAPRIGQTLGDYRIDQWIGSGGMGDVYRAKDNTLGRDVALKILPEGFTREHARVSRFRREAQILASLNHSAIGAIHGLEHAGGMYFLVLELVDGGSLADRLKQGHLPVDEALRIAFQIAEALSTAHDKGIIHRDLKPANIGLTKNGQVKVLDFGLAEITDAGDSSVGTFDSPAAASASTVPAVSIGSMFAGTPAYMSPEQARGVPADQRADVWAFGCVLYELLTGKRAFPEATTLSTVALAVETEPDWSAIPGEMAPNVTSLLRGCLERIPVRAPLTLRP